MAEVNDQLDLSEFDPDHLNRVAGVLVEIYGFLPLTIRYQAAAAALDFVREWTKGEADHG